MIQDEAPPTRAPSTQYNQEQNSLKVQEKQDNGPGFEYVAIVSKAHNESDYKENDNRR
jgi:hypothetical protein